MTTNTITEPRHSHYFLGHEAFRQAAEQDLEMFFKIMASDVREKFIEQVIQQTNQLPGNGEVFTQQQLSFYPCSIDSHMTMIIQLPEPKAYIECFYCAVVSSKALTEVDDDHTGKFDFFTLELGEGDDNQNCSMFCKWEGDTHFNLAEVSLGLSVSEFSELISAFYNAKSNHL
ncbi:MAG: hypothetical protein HWE27_04220 [Gammaproteobacteria bacterium]|nr:hypothetical protein [Gammaproteobacteria bacterium]